MFFIAGEDHCACHICHYHTMVTTTGGGVSMPGDSLPHSSCPSLSQSATVCGFVPLHVGRPKPAHEFLRALGEAGTVLYLAPITAPAHSLPWCGSAWTAPWPTPFPGHLVLRPVLKGLGQRSRECVPPKVTLFPHLVRSPITEGILLLMGPGWGAQSRGKQSVPHQGHPWESLRNPVTVSAN